MGIFGFLLWVFAFAFAALSIDQVRRAVLIAPAFRLVRGTLPTVSDTEAQALEAGTVGFDAELFSGDPDWDKLRSIAPIVLTAEEQAFLDGPTDELCRIIDDWQVRHTEREVSDEIWDFVKKHGFLGMLISKEHGGLGFSAQAQSLIIGKIASRSPDVVTIVMVPNSLGPGELIEKYGTDQQKSYYLPRLARGDEIPCFSLTGPTSGSDAATMRDIGTVERGDGGRRRLPPVVGQALHHAGAQGDARRSRLPRLRSRQHSRQGREPRHHGGHDPGRPPGRRDRPPAFAVGRRVPQRTQLGQGRVHPHRLGDRRREDGGPGLAHADGVPGGRPRHLAAVVGDGRHQGDAAVHHRPTGASASSSGLPVARMEGIEEPLSRMVEAAYANEAARAVTAAMVSRGERPSVISALMKYQTTERMRRSVNDAFDIHGGRAICDGPSNYLQSAYQMVPVGITVEGANILTRTLITFAQGALRSHPYLYKEIQAAQDPDAERGRDAFETAFTDHISYAVANATGAFFHNLTGGRFVAVPDQAYEMADWYRQLGRASRNFAFVADLTVAALGGALKTKQKISGRLADALSELYFLACVLKRFEDDGRLSSDRDLVAIAADQRPLSFPGGAARRRRQFPECARARADAHCLLPARQPLPAGARCAVAPRVEAGVGGAGGARSPHASYLSSRRTPTIRPACSRSP